MKLTIFSIFTFLALIAGAALTFFGLLNTTHPWDGRDVLIRYSVYLLVCISLTVLISVAWSKPLIVAGFILTALIAILAGAFWPLLVLTWIILASSILGQYFLTRIGVNDHPFWARLLVGLGLYGTVIGFLAHFPVNFPGLYGLGLLLPVALGWQEIRLYFQQLCAQFSSTEKQPLSYLWLESAIVALGLVHFVVALMPEVGHDALAVHLFVPSHLFSNHQWGFDASTYVWAVMPMMGDWIFALGFMLAGEVAARLINVGFIFLLGWLVRDLVLWAGGTGLGTRWAVLIFLSTPLTFTESSSLFIESVWTSFVVAGTLVVLMACSSDENRKNNFILAGVLLGCALATKAVTFPFLAVLVLILIWRHKTWFKSGMTVPLVLGLGLFLLIGAVPYITAWWLTGNPVFPFFNKIFQSTFWPPVNFDPSAQGKGLSWDFIYGVTFNSGKYLEARAGAGGFQWLLLFLPVSVILLFTRHRRGISLIIFGLLAITFVFHSTAYLRYIFPAYVVLAAVIGVGLSVVFSNQGKPIYTRLMWISAVLTVLLNVLFLNAGAAYGDFTLTSIYSERHRESYLATRQPIRNAVGLVNSLNTETTPVAVFASPLVAGLKSDALYANWYNYAWQTAYFAAQSEAALKNILKEKNVQFLIVDSNWNASGNVSKEQIALLNQVSTKIIQLGSITVRRMNGDD